MSVGRKEEGKGGELTAEFGDSREYTRYEAFVVLRFGDFVGGLVFGWCCGRCYYLVRG